MKKLLLILLCLPMIGFGQDDCGRKPKNPQPFNSNSNSKEYKLYKKELKIWENCMHKPFFKTEYGTFDYANGVRYKAIFDEDLNIESQLIKINANVTLVGYPMRTAEMKVDKKDGRTRITVTNFDFGEVSTTGGGLYGGVYVGGDYTEYYKIDVVVWNEKKQTFKKSFIDKYSKKLETSILLSVDRLAKASEDDDW